MDNKKLATGELQRGGLEQDRPGRRRPEPDEHPVSTTTPRCHVADMNAKCRRVENLGLVVIDYLQLMTVRRRQAATAAKTASRWSRDISRSLKIMAKELNVPVLCLSQLSRANESRDRTSGPCCPTCVNPAPSSRTPTSSCSSTGTTIIMRNTENQQPGRVHRGQEPPRRDRHGQAPVAA